MNVAGHDIGVCSWSLKASSPDDLVDRLRQLELSHLQLALGDLIDLPAEQRDAAIKTYKDAGISVTAGMIGFAGEDYSTIANIRRTGGFLPDALWGERRERTLRAGEIAQSIGVDRLTTHIGFVPGSHDAGYGTMVGRVGEVAKLLESHGVGLGLETGQEHASELLKFLNDVNSDNVFVNFDPANMILYGAGEPIEAIGTLGRHIDHVHVKDAILSVQPGTAWGEEVPFGTGQVGPIRFLAAVKLTGYSGPLVIEREAGPNRMADVQRAVRVLQSLEKARGAEAR